ncbi:hypothetical protein MHYP_G00154920 [Metynnis hypsauchen]
MNGSGHGKLLQYLVAAGRIHFTSHCEDAENETAVHLFSFQPVSSALMGLVYSPLLPALTSPACLAMAGTLF